MTDRIEGRARELLQEPNFCFVATLRKDGTPHITPVWVDVDGDEVVLNSARGRRWPENLRRDERVTLAVPNWQNPYEYVAIRGRLATITEDGADAHIDAMAKKYMGRDTYPLRQDGEVRLIVRIRPDRVQVSG